MRIAILNTGGTISCVGAPLAPMPAAEFAAACQRLLGPWLAMRHAGLQLDFPVDLRFPGSASGTLDSTNLQPTDWLRMARWVLAHYTEYDAFVVLHGTDSMAHSGAALSFLLNGFAADGQLSAALSRPVLLTGSQLPLFAQSAAGLTLNAQGDALANLDGALHACQRGVCEVAVYFQRALWRGNRVLKTDAQAFAAFAAPNDLPLIEDGLECRVHGERFLPPPASPARSLESPAARAAQLALLDALQARLAAHPVWTLLAQPADGQANPLAQAIHAAVAAGARGLLLLGYGAGNFPSGDASEPARGAVYQALAQARQQGVQLVGGTQTPHGGVNGQIYAAGAWLAQLGALNPGDMTPVAAQVKLSVLLALAELHGWSAAQVAMLFQRALLGEMRDATLLDSRRGGVLRPGEALLSQDGGASVSLSLDEGLRLCAADGRLLWQAPGSAQASLLRLGLDGALSLLGRSGEILWATPPLGGAAAWLRLDGQCADGSLTLRLGDAGADIGRVLWSAADGQGALER